MRFDIIVIGSGQAGVPLAVRLAGAGRRVLLAERGALGGTCVNTGCTPTKTMIASARAAHVARTAARLGVHTGPVRVDFPAVVARKDEMVERWRDGVRKRLASAGERLRVVEGHARFVGPRAVEVAGERHEADVVVVNVGARPAVPPIEGLDRVPWLDHRRAMELRALPSHLVVVGGGYIGCELAQAFRRFGADVTIVEPGPHLLSHADEDVSEALEGAFRAEGIALRTGARATHVEPRGDGVAVTLSTGDVVEGSHLLVATGRRPNTDDLGAGAAGLALDERGFLPVDDAYRTGVPGVYAAGDVTGGPQFTHAAWDDHRLLFDVLTGRPARRRRDRVIPYTAYTDPQVAGVGLTERAAREQGVRHEAATLPFASVARAAETGETAGVLKVLVDPDTDRLLGAAIVGAEAGELIHGLAVLIAADAPVRALVDLEAVHPSFFEGVQSVVMRLARHRLS